jgi:lysosomal acid phosphatase
MIEHMELKSMDALIPDRKLWIYSAHDETIANMLMTLNLFEPHCPPYTATILLELRINTKNEHVVTVSTFLFKIIYTLIVVRSFIFQ